MSRKYEIALLLVLALNVAGLIAIWYLETSHILATNSHVAADDFRTVGGVRLDNSSARCRIIHYTARTCTFCRQEHDFWLRLKYGALARHCDVIALVPNVTEIEPSRSSETALFVKPSFAGSFRATRTPTTVLTDRNGVVKWHKEGILQDSDSAEVVPLIEKLVH